MDDFVVDEDVFWNLKIAVLHDMRDELAKNLYPDKFFAYFRSKRIFDADDCDNINAERTRRKQAELFLDILESKGPDAFDEFCRFINKNKTQVYLLHKILDKFEQRKGEILDEQSRSVPSDFDLGDKTPTTTTPTTVLMPPNFNSVLPGPPTPPDEVPGELAAASNDDVSSTTTFTGNSVSQPSTADATYPGPTPPPYTVPPNTPPPPYTECV